MLAPARREGRAMSAFRGIFLVAALAASVPVLPLEPDKLFEKVSSSVVVVWAIDSNGDKSAQGSGIVISPSEVVTNCHVIKEATSIVVEQGKRTSEARLRYFDTDRDLCQLAMENRIGIPISGIVSYRELKVGQRVYTVGAPIGLELSLGEGIISQLRGGEEFDFIQTTAPVSHGSSGGGLFDKDGRLIGITTFNLPGGQNLNFAIPANWIFELAPRHAQVEQKRLEEAQGRAEQEKLRREEDARGAEEQKRVEEQRRVDEAKREEERRQRVAVVERERLQQEAARKQREGEETWRPPEARAAEQKLIDDWKARIQARIKNRVVVPPNMEGNPEVRFEVVLLPGGEVLSATLRKSSGNPAYDAEVERAIMAAQPLPVPSETDLFQENFRELTLVFRPKDREMPSADVTTEPNRSAALEEPRMLVTYGQLISMSIKGFQKYPPPAQRRGWEGTAEVLLQIAADGKVTGMTLGKSSGHAILDEEALDMVRRASPLPQAPPDLRGRALVVSVPIVFRLYVPEPTPQ